MPDLRPLRRQAKNATAKQRQSSGPATRNDSGRRPVDCRRAVALVIDGDSPRQAWHRSAASQGGCERQKHNSTRRGCKWPATAGMPHHAARACALANHWREDAVGARHVSRQFIGMPEKHRRGTRIARQRADERLGRAPGQLHPAVAQKTPTPVCAADVAAAPAQATGLPPSRADRRSPGGVSDPPCSIPFHSISIPFLLPRLIRTLASCRRQVRRCALALRRRLVRRSLRVL